MVTLYKRANPAQRKLLKIIEGAVLNAADAHGETRNPVKARSIAKRAAGTISAQWPVLLASAKTSVRSVSTDYDASTPERQSGLNSAKTRRGPVLASEDGKVLCVRRLARRVTSSKRRHPLLILWKQISVEMGQIKRSGDQAKFEAHIHLLKMIDALHRKLEDQQ